MFKHIMKWATFVVGMVGFLILCGPVSADQADTGVNGIGFAMLINASSISGLFTSLNAAFNKGFKGAKSTWEKTTMKIQSTSESETYAWLSDFPRMRKWVGEKVVKALEAFKYTIINDDFEATVAVKRNHIKDDKLGSYGKKAQAAGKSAAVWPDELIADLKNNAFLGICYDGQYFYDTDHPVAGASVSNKGTAALSVASQAAALASYGAAREAIMSFTDNEGKPLGLVPNILEVPPALESVAKLLCNNPKLADDTPNSYVGTAEVIVNPRLTSSTAWFLHVGDEILMPFVFQEREAPVFVQQISEENNDVFMKAEYKFGVEARGNAGYGLWPLSYGSTGAA